MTFSREQWGQRTFDLNQDGVANYGMYADWLQELHTLAGRPILSDMFHGAEAYLEMWERAVRRAGHPLPARPRQRSAPAASPPAPRREPSSRSLYAAGQPLARPGTAFQYCDGGALRRRLGARGRADRHGVRPPGSAALVLSSASGHRLAGIAPGARLSATRLKRLAGPVGGGVWVGRHALARGSRGVRACAPVGTVREVGVATRPRTAGSGVGAARGRRAAGL